MKPFSEKNTETKKNKKSRVLFSLIFIFFTCSGGPFERLSSCPESPNCVSSLANAKDKHFVSPFKFSGKKEEIREVILLILKKEKNCKVISAEQYYIHAEFRSSLFRFVDDLEIMIVPEKEIIHMKSSSRTGYYDFGVNRKRIERLKREIRKADSDQK